MTHNSESYPAHVHDLPQIYTKPSARILLDTLEQLRKATTSFSSTDVPCQGLTAIDPVGVARYLTGIIASPLTWLSEDEREQVWTAASLRLSERSGRTAAPAMTRSFVINDHLELKLHEPSLTGDSLGLKTWTSSLLLAKQLPEIAIHIPAPSRIRALELGAGTGLVGLAAAAIWSDRLSEVILTDLPEIVPNLTKNIGLNRNHSSGEVSQPLVESRVLDWSDIRDAPENESSRYSLIIAADPIYSDEHPILLTDTICRWLANSSLSRVIIALPLRAGYESERNSLAELMAQKLEKIAEGLMEGHDDWEDDQGQLARVQCLWTVWQPKS